MTLIQPNYKKRQAKLDESPLTPFYSVKFNFTPSEEYQYPSGFYGIEWTDALHKLCVKNISTTKFIGIDTDTGLALPDRIWYLWSQDKEGNITSLEMKSLVPFSEGEFKLMREFSELWTVSGKHATIQMSDVSPYEAFTGTRFKTETALLLYTNPRADRETGKPLLHRACEGQTINTLLFFFHKDTSVKPQKLFMESFVKDEETNWVTGIIPSDRNPYGKDMIVKVRVISVIKKTVQTRGSRCSPFPFSFHVEIETEFPITDCYGLGFSSHFGSGRLKMVEEFS